MLTWVYPLWYLFRAYVLSDQWCCGVGTFVTFILVIPASYSDQPVFTLKQVVATCEHMIKQREERIREDYDKVLNDKMQGLCVFACVCAHMHTCGACVCVCMHMCVLVLQKVVSFLCIHVYVLIFFLSTNGKTYYDTFTKIQ